MTGTVFDRDEDGAAPTHPNPLAAWARRCCAAPADAEPARAGSRRRRLWELDSHAHCPVVGLCLPVSALRRLMQRHASGFAEDDYELHCQGVNAARQRSALSEAMQRDLDQRHALPLAAAARLKDEPALLTWWQAERHGPQMAGALWALLTHARCGSELEATALGHVHMQQHEIGQLARAQAERQRQLHAEQLRLTREHAALAARWDEALRLHTRERERLQDEALRLRGVVLAREALATQLQAQLVELREAQPDLPARQALSRQVQEQAERLRDLQRALDRAQQDNERLRAEAAVGVPAEAAASQALGPAPAPVTLRDRAVLCVGGRTGAVPLYRQVVEAAGARFLHHDGGDEDNAQRLESTLAAADLVICQAGCVSHGAYWRVKDHCKRTGKRCVFVEQPSASSLQRALDTIGQAEAS
jgi:hypothetical protein